MQKKVKALTKNQRISPRKARLAAGLIRGLGVEEAALQLQYCNLKGGALLNKTLASAVANAENRFEDVRREDLKVIEVRVDAAKIMKRSKSKNKGGQVPVMKRNSHFTVVVGTKEEGDK